MRILDEAKRLLERYGYFASVEGQDTILFEDDSLIGFVCEGPLQQILSSWSARQDEFVRKNAGPLRTSSTKAWNLYSVFLTADLPTADEKNAITNIEEDFHATRKIVQAEITTLGDVTRALYSFIPIQNLVSLSTDNTLRTLRARLSSIPNAAVEALLDQSKSDDFVLQAFQEGHATKED